MKSTVNTRLQDVLKSLRIDAKEASRIIGMEYTTLKRIADGETTKPSSSTIKLICTGLNVNYQFLSKGIGEMFEPQKDTQTSNPWKDAMISQMKSEIDNLREMLKLALKGSFPLVLERTGSDQ
ncbi:MAG: Cro/C1-type DNA-binding domain [Bacteroidetes bacterium]|nr:Cro/C1-type DNA-binding domain [Bacteroidota bacterium]